MVISAKTKNMVDDLDRLQDNYKMFDFCNLNKEHNLFLNEFKKIPFSSKIEPPKSLYINNFVCLRKKCYVYTTELDGNDNKFKGIS